MERYDEARRAAVMAELFAYGSDGQAASMISNFGGEAGIRAFEQKVIALDSEIAQLYRRSIEILDSVEGRFDDNRTGRLRSRMEKEEDS